MFATAVADCVTDADSDWLLGSPATLSAPSMARMVSDVCAAANVGPANAFQSWTTCASVRSGEDEPNLASMLSDVCAAAKSAPANAFQSCTISATLRSSVGLPNLASMLSDVCATA